MPAVTKYNTPTKTSREVSKSEKVMDMIDSCDQDQDQMLPKSFQIEHETTGSVENMSAVTGINDPLKVAEYGLEPATAGALQRNFMPFFEKAEYWKRRAEMVKVDSADQVNEMRIAREMRLAIRQVRLDADKLRKRLKEDGLRYGKAVQGVYNVVEFLLEPTEKYLHEQETFIERQKEQKIKDDQIARYAEIQQFLDFVPIEFHNSLGTLSVDSYAKMYNQAKKSFIEDQELQRKAEAEARAEAEAKERAEAEAKKKADEEKKRLQAELAEAKKKAEAERAMREEEGKKRKAEREAREAELAKAKAKANEETKKRIEAEKRFKESQRMSPLTIQDQVSPFPTRSLLPPEPEQMTPRTKRLDNESDAEVLQAYINQLTGIMLSIPSMKSLAGKKLVIDIDSLITKLIKFAQDGINKLK